ncbi:hypothetical protein [Prochlorococcus sp. MIT 1300]|uniref:hypothetical protein n=1 Tax=Prochlorococcus sp. MIT 1300 TaxID=3096218 RepID=UPI002A75EBFE|nr:hypothetical protein [Prochlorococcus sp. MIT 1300]
MSLRTPRAKSSGLLGRYPGRTLQRIGVALTGVWLTNLAMGIAWPEPDQVASRNSSDEYQTKFNPLPKKPVVVIFIRIKGNPQETRDWSPLEESEISNYLLAKIEKGKPLDVIAVPLELPVSLPALEGLSSFANAYRHGGLAVTYEMLKKRIKLPKDSAVRYALITDSSLIKLDSQLDSLQIKSNPPSQVSKEKYIGLLPKQSQNSNRELEDFTQSTERSRTTSLRDIELELRLNEFTKNLNELKLQKRLSTFLSEIHSSISTNISRKELSSLTSAILAIDKPSKFSKLSP